MSKLHLPKWLLEELPEEQKLEVPTLKEFLEDTGKAPQWLVEGFIPHGGLTVVTGAAKAGHKSLWAISNMYAIATGQQLGTLIPKFKMKTLLVEQEGTKNGLFRAFTGLARGFNVDIDTIDESLRPAHNYFIKLDTIYGVRQLYHYVMDNDIDFIVLDPLVSFQSGDENNAGDMRRIMDAVGYLLSHEKTVMFLHHVAGKTEGRKAGGKHIDEQGRGSSVIMGRYDAHHAMRDFQGGTEHDLTFRCRLKAGEEQIYKLSWNFTYEPGDERTKSKPIITFDMKDIVEERDEESISI